MMRRGGLLGQLHVVEVTYLEGVATRVVDDGVLGGQLTFDRQGT